MIEKNMRYFFVYILVLAQFIGMNIQASPFQNIPPHAIFYNSKWMGVSSAAQAAYYRIVGSDNTGKKIFRDYYITGQLKAEKYYITIDKKDDHRTILTGVCRTFYKTGKLESIMQYVNGKAHGRAISFFSSGKVGMKLNYRNGVLHGPNYTYNERGKIEYTTIWSYGKMVSESAGGKDSYIDKKTGVDMFVTKYSADDGLIQQKAQDIARRKQHTTGASKSPVKDKQMASASKKAEENKGMTQSYETKNYRSQAETQSNVDALEVEVIYPDDISAKDSYAGSGLSAQQSTKIPAGINYEKTGNRYKKEVDKEFSFQYLYELLAHPNRQTNDIKFYDDIAMNYNLNIAQAVTVYAGQKELIYHYNMDYDEVASSDKVIGDNPRQIGFWGNTIGNKLRVRRISIFTWSEAEMMNFALAALSVGYKILGGGNIEKLDGNFILEPSKSTQTEGQVPVTINFVHQNNLYAGLYHIQMELR